MKRCFMNNKSYLPGLGLALMLSSTAVADLYFTEQITASQDNTLIDDPEGARSNGSGPFIFVGLTGGSLGGGIRRGLVHFDLEGVIPVDARIEDVSLHLYADRGGPEEVRLYRVVQDWGEGTSCKNGGSGAPSQTGDATWIHSFYDTSTWDAPGADRSRPAGDARVYVDLPGMYTWSSNRMKRDVQLWVDQPGKNYGWLLIGDERSPQSVVAFASRESITCDGVPTELPQPMLEVGYSLPD
jgi:hypothetical protein